MKLAFITTGKNNEGNIVGDCTICGCKSVEVNHRCNVIPVAEEVEPTKTIFDTINSAKFRRIEIKKLLNRKKAKGSVLIDANEYNEIIEHIDALGILIDEIGWESVNLVNRIFLGDYE